MKNNLHLLKYIAVVLLLILIIIFDVIVYLYSERNISYLQNSSVNLNEIKILSKTLELQQNKFVIYEFSKLPAENITEVYKTQEQLNQKIDYLKDNTFIEKELLEELQIKLNLHETLLDTLSKNIAEHKNIYVILNSKEIISQIFIQIDEIVAEADTELSLIESNFRNNRNIAFKISVCLIFIIIFYIIFIIIKKYLFPLNAISKSINNIVNTDFSKDEELPEINLNNRVGNLAKDIKSMLLKIHEKTDQLTSQKQITENALQNFNVLSEIGKKIITQLDVKEIIKVVYENISPLIPINAFGIGIYNKHENILDFWKLDSYSKKLQYNYEKINDSKDISVISFTQSKEIIINDFFKEYQNYIKDIGASISLNKSMIFSPLRTIDSNIGVIYAKFKHTNAYQQHHLDILKNLAIYIAIAIQNAQSFEHIKYQQREILERNEELNQQREEILNINENLESQKEKLEEAFDDIKLLSKVGQEITSSLNYNQITENIYRSIDKFMDATTFGIGLYNEKENRIEFPKLIEKGAYMPFCFDNLDENSLSVQCFKSHREIHINELKTEYQKYLSEMPESKYGELPSSFIYLPLVTKGKKLGVITVQSFNSFAYKENDLNILRTLATYISTALVNATSFEEIENQRNELFSANEKVNISIKAIEKQKQEIQELANKLEDNYNSIKESEQRMSDIINFIPDPMMVIDKNGILLAWNKSMEELTGVQANEILGKGNYAHSLPFYNNRRPMLCDLALNSELAIESKYSNFEKQGDKLVGQAYVPKIQKILWGAARILLNSKGEIIGAIQVSRDVTDRIRNQQKIEEANQLLNEQKAEIEKQNSEIIQKSQELHALVEELQTTSAIVDAYNKELEKLSIVASKTDNAVIIADANGKIEWVNEGFERLYGLDLHDFRNKFGSTMQDVSHKENFQEIIDDCIKNKKSASYITKNFNGVGKEIWIQTNLTPIFNDENVLVNLIAIDSDITKIKEAEKEIENQNKKTTYSIQYARRIQSAILPPKRLIDRTLAEYFLLYKPRDIVSGDFYWITRRQTKILFAVSDCTGHGVPGAFMSILGISFLNEIVNKIVESSGVEDLIASRILNQLKVNVIKSLHQKGKQLETKDGMDIALCIFDIDSRTIQYAGANNPVYLVRKKSDKEPFEINEDEIITYNEEHEDLVLYEIKPDKTPIGFSKNIIENFRDNNFKVKAGDSVYLFTDGYVDQFGGPLGRKYLSKNFKKTLLEINNSPMAEQEKLLDNIIENWRSVETDNSKIYNQIDDILVMGIRY